jgi:primosomal protein N' (replication factor Y)
MIISEIVFDLPFDKVFDYLPGEFEDQLSPGARVKVSFGKQQKIGIILSILDKKYIKKEDYKKIVKIYDDPSLITEDLFKVASFLSSKYFASLGQSLFSIVGTLPTKYKIENFTQLQEKQFTQGEGFSKTCILLNREKERFEQVLKIVQEYSHGSVIILFPEVVQAENYHDRIKLLYGERVILFHGELKPKEKISAWHKMMSNEKMVIIGTRISVFAPLRDISVFLLNRGYDSSFREQRTPKYDACEVAEYRASYIKKPLFYIETSLSVNKYFEIQKGSMILQKPEESSLLPKIHIFPINKKVTDKKISFLTQDTLSLLEETILKGEKVAIIHNNRGSFKMLRCDKCGSRLICKTCDSELVLSDDGKNLLCRFCKTITSSQNKCDNCGSKKISIRLYGIEKMFQLLKDEYPSVGISKIISQSKPVTLNDFSILIGTRGIKQYLQNYSFGLVVFVSGESFLNIPEYKSEENFFLLVNEIRASLTNPKCRIIIQSRNPNLEIYKSLKENDPSLFLDKEILVRKELEYPPFAEIIKVEFKNKKQRLLEEKESLLDNYFAEKKLQVIYSGPSFPPIKKGKDVWKYLIRIGESFDREHFKETMYQIGASVEFNPDRV